MKIKKKMKMNFYANRIFWAIILLLSAALIILDAVGTGLGFLDGIPVIKIILGVLLLAMAVREGICLDYAGVIFSLTFLFLLFERNIARWCGIESGELINNWLALLAALLVVIALKLLTGGFRITACGGKEDDVDKKSFGHYVKYIDCTSFTREEVESNMGYCEIIFQNVDNYLSGGTLVVENNLGAMEIRVPASWHVDASIENSLGSVVLPREDTPDGKVLHIVGENNLGSLSVKTV